MCLITKMKAQSTTPIDNFVRWFFQSEKGWPFATAKVDSTKLYYADGLNNNTLQFIENTIVAKDTLYSIWEADPEQNKYIVLDASEKRIINQELGKMQGKKLWSQKLFDNAQPLDRKMIDNIFCNIIGQFEFFRNYPNGFYEFSRPIFLRNESICIFYCSLNCGSLCLDSNLLIFIKKDGKWEKWMTISKVIS